MKVKIFNDFNPELERYWKTLERGSDCHIFQTYDWSIHWYRIIGIANKINLTIAVILKDNDPIIIFPFGMKTILGTQILEFLGGKQSDYQTPLLHSALEKNDSILSSAFNLVLKRLPKFHIAVLTNMPSHFQTSSNPFVKLWNSVAYDVSYSATLPKDFGLFQSRLKTKLISDIKRQKKRLENKGVLSFEIITDKIKSDDLILTMIEQKRDRYNRTNVPDYLSKEYNRNFYIQHEVDDNKSFIVHFAVLRLDDEVIATHWGCIYKDYFYYLMPTYSSKYMVYSPGKILLEFLIEWAINNNIKIFDFTIGGEEYKTIWCDKRMELFHNIYVNKPYGYIYYYFISFLGYAKKRKRFWNILRKVYSMYQQFFIHEH